MIKNYALKHGWYYYYRLHHEKCTELNNGLATLKDFLEEVGLNCPNHYFTQGPRSSALTFKLKNIDVHSIEGHPISIMAREALKNSDTRSAHTNVEVFLLKHDHHTLAVEVPLWLENNEIMGFKELFKSDLPLTGHIDILRIEDGNIWVWDYKPNASQEVYAITQTFFYAYMLSKRTKIPIENFRCGYFDSNYAFVFNPSQASIIQDNTLANFL